jgi:hypothetical protein
VHETVYRWAYLVVIVVLLFSGCGSDEAMKYDPENYKTQIQTIETLLSKPAVEPGDGGKLHKYSAELAKAVGQDIQHHTQKQTVMNVIISFGEVFAHQEEQEIPWDISQARELWKQVRGNLFQQADWFQAL